MNNIQRQLGTEFVRSRGYRRLSASSVWARSQWLPLALLLLMGPIAPTFVYAEDPITPVAVRIKLGEVKLFKTDAGQVSIDNSNPARCGAYLIGNENTEMGVLFVPYMTGKKAVEVTVASKAHLVVYRITVVDSRSDAPGEVVETKVDLDIGDSVVFGFLNGDLDTLGTATWAYRGFVVGTKDTRRGLRIVGEWQGSGYIAAAAKGSLKLFRVTVKPGDAE